MSIFKAKIKNKIPRIGIQAMNLHMGHRLFLYFLFGIVAGTFILNFLMGNMSHKIEIYSEYFSKGIKTYDIHFDKIAFFIFCCKRYVKEFLIIIIVNMTPIAIIFNRGYCIYKGIIISMIISSLTLNYGAWGILLYVISIFPHYILYIPFIILALYIGNNARNIINKRKMKSINIKVIVLVALLILGTSYFETYINVFILKSAFY